ncbi:hypothetical protein [Ornithinibacillus halotolerans]|uniref:DUF3784 domain-containing protein n=1 Tax=Ornithinibacillus halotolerans TaxID=1274357 RepID=A0A916S580_9BACI|nr:hypothetical protein [Ornithinibacillus halotolerans]GGA85088.1 hypothetical protein GCM10008025_30150 [Ornithinibacillus halotolerans]
MPFQVFIVLFIGLVFIVFGYLIFSGKAPTLLDFFLKQGVTYEDKRSNRFFGLIIIIIGIAIMLLPLILGVENMNI